MAKQGKNQSQPLRPRKPRPLAACNISEAQAKFNRECFMEVESGRRDKIMFAPKLSYLEKRLEKCYLRKVFVWLPLKQFKAHVRVLYCPECNRATSPSASEMKARAVLDTSEYFYLVYKRYTCQTCNKKFTGIQSEVLANLLVSVNIKFDIILAGQELAVTNQFANLLLNSWLRIGAENTATMFATSHVREFEKRQLDFLAAHTDLSLTEMPFNGEDLRRCFAVQAMRHDQQLKFGGVQLSEEEKRRSDEALQLFNLRLDNLEHFANFKKEMFSRKASEDPIKYFFGPVKKSVDTVADLALLFENRFRDMKIDRPQDVKTLNAALTEEMVQMLVRIRHEDHGVKEATYRKRKSRAREQFAQWVMRSRSFLVEKSNQHSSFETLLNTVRWRKEVDAKNREAWKKQQESARALGTSSSSTTEDNNRPADSASEPIRPELINNPFGSYEDQNGYNGYVFPLTTVDTLARILWRRKREFIVQAIASIKVDILKFDTCWKIKDWVKYKLPGTDTPVPLYKSLTAVANGVGLIAGMAYGHYFEKHHEIEDLLLSIKETQEMLTDGWKLGVAYSDKCCQNRDLIQRIFGVKCQSKLDLFHWFHRLDPWYSKGIQNDMITKFSQDMARAFSNEQTGDLENVRAIPQAADLEPKVRGVFEKYIELDLLKRVENEKLECQFNANVNAGLSSAVKAKGGSLTAAEREAVLNSIENPPRHVPLFRESIPTDQRRFVEFVEEQLSHVKLGCLSDPEGIPVIFEPVGGGRLIKGQGTGHLERFFRRIGEALNNGSFNGPERAE